MKKSAMLLGGVLVFATAMLAQDSQSSSGSSSQYPSGSQSGSSQAGSGSTGQYGSEGSQSGSSGSMSGQTGTSGSQSGSMSSGQNSSDQANASTVEGCIYREATDYYIYPTHGSQMKVSGQDVSAHLGHHVKLHGTKQAGSTTASTGGGTGAAAGESGSAGSSQASGQGSMAGSAGRSGTAGSSNEFMVERVDMVSASCPSKIRKKIESQGGNLGSSDTGSSSGNNNNPPKQ